MADFTLLHPLWLLALIPLVILLPWLYSARQKTSLIAPHLAKHFGITPQNNTRFTYGLAVVWLISIIALSGPSWQKSPVPAYSLSGARVLVMDMSRSMYATDVTPNRLTQARFKALDLLPGWQEGSTGLVTYAADGYVVSPLTQDSTTLASLIPYLSPELLPIQGSNAAAGIEEAITLLKQAGHAVGDIVLVTDGLSQKESEQSLALLNKHKFRLSILAVGTQQGAPIQLADGRILNDQRGQPVIDKVDLDTLLPLVRQTGGTLQLSQNDNRDVEALIALTAKPQQQANQSKDKTLDERINNGFWLLFPICLLALFGFRRGLLVAIPLVLLPVHDAKANPWQTRDQEGLSLYQQQDYNAAAEHFTDPAWQGVSQYKNGDFPAAIETLSSLDDANSRYNLGNAYAQNGQYEEALKAYDQALKQQPDFAQAQKNRSIVQQAK
ncbi:VWA domain-containing protein, partial [Photobacterium swingsii]|uniref:vWA domain-containing protein n=1 Tax=Photobacterium swingsii TaxID=680026 RepID=UPI00354B4338